MTSICTKQKAKKRFYLTEDRRGHINYLASLGLLETIEIEFPDLILLKLPFKDTVDENPDCSEDTYSEKLVAVLRKVSRMPPPPRRSCYLRIGADPSGQSELSAGDYEIVWLP